MCLSLQAEVWLSLQAEVCSGVFESSGGGVVESLSGVLQCAYSSAHLSASVMSLLVPIPLATSCDPPAEPPRCEHTATAQSCAATATQSCQNKSLFNRNDSVCFSITFYIIMDICSP